jgi:hypothetical protein
MAEPERKKRGGSDLHQDNWDKEDDGDAVDPNGPFKAAAPEELAKRRIVKARRRTDAPVPENAAEKPADTGAEKTPFSWGAPVAAASAGGDAAQGSPAVSKDEPAKAAEEPKPSPAASKDEQKDSNGDKDAADGNAGEKKEADKDGSPAKPAPFTFGNFNKEGFSFGTKPGGFSFGGFGSTTSSSGGGSGGFPAAGASKPSFSFGSVGTASFGSVVSSGWAAKKTEVGAEDKEGGDAADEEEDAEKEVAVTKSDAVVQLQEVETSTGEEDEEVVFQVRAKLFTFGVPGSGAEGAEGEGDKKEGESNAEEKKDAKPTWNVTGVGNLKLNVPKADAADKSRRPRIVMRRQKTFQVCLNTYLFDSMVCDKAGPKDVRFTGMRSEEGSAEAALATYLIRVKDEESADAFIAAIQKHKGTA